MATSRKFGVILIEEGLGNLKDLFYYTREALQSGVDAKLFEGAKCNADHPDALEEQVQPEGSVRKIVGHYENVRLTEGDEGQAQIAADLVVLDGAEYDWAVSLLERALVISEKAGKDFVGLSINANGNASTISLAEFLKSATIPKSAIPKLQAAQEQGIEQIEICSQLTEAVSCDLVTRAGAKGRVVKLLETEKLRMATPAKSSKKVTEGKKQDGGAGGEQPGHADAGQDKELISSMLKKALGDGDHDEAAHEAMHAAHQAAMEVGYEGEEAEKMAVGSMKMAHHQAKKQAEAEAKAAEESEGEGEGEGKQAEAAAGGDSEDPAADAGAQPSKPPKGKMEREVIQLKAQNAKLMERFAAIDAQTAREKALRESGLHGEALKALSSIVAKKSSEASIKEAVATFKEAYGVAAKENDGLVISPEKNAGQTGNGFSLADCVKE